MKPHVKIAVIQAINYVLTNGGDITEFKQYGYTECNTGVNVYYQRTTGKCFLFANTTETIYNSLEVWYERKNIRKETKSTTQTAKRFMEAYDKYQQYKASC